MSKIIDDLKYASSHEWARVENDGSVTIGITDHAQALLGDIVFIELPEVERTVNASEEAGVVESVKAASDIYSPISGTIIAVNEKLTDAPEQVNSDPYGDGWIFRLQPTDQAELSKLLDAESYAKQVEAEGH